MKLNRNYSLLFLACCFFIAQTKIFSQSLSLTVKKFIAVNEDTLALEHVTIVDGTGGPVKQDQTIVIANGKIFSIQSSAGMKPASTIKVMDCSGKTIIPGMIMMHEHMFYGELVSPHYLGMEMPETFPKLYLAGGVTTLRTTGAIEPQTDLNIRDEIKAGKIPGPDMDVTGPYIQRAGMPMPEMLNIKTTEDAVNEVNYWIGMGVTSFKAYMNLTKADLATVVSLAHQHHLKVTGHLCSLTYREAADAGIDNLEHGFWVSSDFEKNKTPDQCNGYAQNNSIMALDEKSPAMKELMAYLIKKNVAITSTLPVFEPYTNREIFPGDGGAALAKPLKDIVEKNYAASVGKDSAASAMFKKEMAWEKQFADMGGRLMAGIDPTGAGRVIPGYADRHVPELMVEAGLSFPQAIKICSLNAAVYSGRDNEIGTIEIGKRADMVLINGDPMKDIRSVRNTEIVFKNGVGFDSKKLFESVTGKAGLH